MRLRILGPIVLLSLAACAFDRSEETPSSLQDEPGDGVDGDGAGEEDDVAPAEEQSEAAAEEADDDARAMAAGELDDLHDDSPAPSEIPPAESIAEPTAAAPKILYVNFGGPVIRNCSSFCNDSAANRSTIIGQKYDRSSVDFLPYTSTTGRRTIVSALKTYFSRYNVTVTTSRPASTVKYTMAVVSPSKVGPTSVRGTSYLDCNNAMKSDIVFVVRIGGASASTIARYVAHEVGHSLGLMHVTSSGDLMQYASSGTRWTVARLDVARNPRGFTCWPGKSTQDEPAALRAVLGLRP